jgi:hypothetical protein
LRTLFGCGKVSGRTRGKEGRERNEPNRLVAVVRVVRIILFLDDDRDCEGWREEGRRGKSECVGCRWREK